MHPAILAWNVVARQDAPLKAVLQLSMVLPIWRVIRVDELRSDALILTQTVRVRTTMIGGGRHTPLHIDHISGGVRSRHLGSPAVFGLVPIGLRSIRFGATWTDVAQTLTWFGPRPIAGIAPGSYIGHRLGDDGR